MKRKAVFVAVLAALFAASAAVTGFSCASMSAMGEMAMPGGWTMSMTWMRMPGQSWTAAAASFLAMWIVMMAAMMLPSLALMLWEPRGRDSIPSPLLADMPRLDAYTALIVAGYFLVWSAAGLGVYAAGVTLASIAMQQPDFSRLVPLAMGGVVFAAGAVQFSAWKARHLGCCRAGAARGPCAPRDALAVLRCGLRLGLHCCCTCAGPIAVLLVLGVMDLRVMAVVTAAITVERFTSGERVARGLGAVALAAGLLLVARAASV